MDGVKTLTKKEFEILLLICRDNLSRIDIANTLSIAPSTVHTHITNIYQKTGISTRADLIWEFYNGRNQEPKY